MNPEHEYSRRGATLLKSLFPKEIVSAMAHQISLQVSRAGSQTLTKASLGNKPCHEASCVRWPVLETFLWGLTPRISDLTGKNLLPTYAYFRTYQQGDVCRIHSDRPACEHSLSLTLAYSDDIQWPLAVADLPFDPSESAGVTGMDHFGSTPSTAFPMSPGDAVLYRGKDYCHGRPMPNPNRWSAHLFLHWVDRDGPNANLAFDQRPMIGPIDFHFAR